MRHLLKGVFFRVSPRCETPSYKYYLIMIAHSFSPKMCCKKFENRFTNENLTSKNVLNRDFCMEKLLAMEVTIFSEKNKSFNILLKVSQNQHQIVRKDNQESKRLNEVDKFARIQSYRFLDFLPCLCKIPIQKHF